MLSIVKPTLLLDKSRAINNIRNMASKANRCGVRFRPHFKTHQSAEIGKWFKDVGIHSITVSSLDMADYFAKNGWNDITVAFPVNILEIEKINRLAKTVNLNLLVESNDSIELLEKQLTSKVNVWIKIDTGYKRTGISWDAKAEVRSLVEKIGQTEMMKLSGMLTHSGNTYQAGTNAAILKIYKESVSRMTALREYLDSKNIQNIEISIGDTPSCSLVDDLSGVDEIRPGNFIFNDIMQLHIGACAEENIAVGVACPVVAKHDDRNELVIYGGAIHLSKDFIEVNKGENNFGNIALLGNNGWGRSIKNDHVSSLSQEHGIVKADREFIRPVQIGDILVILPIHSCLTVNLMKKYFLFDNTSINIARI